MEVISVDNIDVDDPHGYCTPSPVDVQKQFRVPWKRANLGHEVRELHIMNDARVIPPPTTGYFNKQLLCKLIDDILDVQKPKPGHVERVKRQLFRKGKDTPRKSAITRKNNRKLSTAFNFRYIRWKVGYQKIKKNYLNEARITVEMQVRTERASKQGPSSSSTDSSNSADSKISRRCAKWSATANGMLLIKTDDGMFPISPDTLTEICKYHGKMVRQHPYKNRTEYEQFKRNLNTEACRLSRRASKLAGLILEEQYRQRARTNSNVLDESIRSMHYLKSLFDMLTEQEEKKASIN